MFLFPALAGSCKIDKTNIWYDTNESLHQKKLIFLSAVYDVSISISVESIK
jgi:hypothetical protein